MSVVSPAQPPLNPGVISRPARVMPVAVLCECCLRWRLFTGTNYCRECMDEMASGWPDLED